MSRLRRVSKLTTREIAETVAAAASSYERERIAKIVEGLDNTMMNQIKLAAHIRSLKDEA